MASYRCLRGGVAALLLNIAYYAATPCDALCLPPTPGSPARRRAATSSFAADRRRRPGGLRAADRWYEARAGVASVGETPSFGAAADLDRGTPSRPRSGRRRGWGAIPPAASLPAFSRGRRPPSSRLNQSRSSEGASPPTATVREREAVVRRYFDGVNEKDPVAMASCFASRVELRDMCGPSRGEPRHASPADMADRCMEFLAAHPDCRVEFESPPICDREGEWVWCHWVESGHWTGESLGVKPGNTVLNVGGHTRFLLEEQQDGSQQITKQVVYRTFSEWELSL